MSAAELELNIGTSTVSRHVKDLETRLGLTLCRRGRAGFALTPEGPRVYEETLRLLASVRGFLGSIDDIHDRMGGASARIFMGVMLGVGFHLLNGLFSNLGMINAWPPFMAALTPSLIFLAAAAWLLRYVERR